MAEIMDSKDFATKGVAGAGLGLGIAGTALGLLSGGLGNWLNGNAGSNNNSSYNALMMENSILKANADTDKKLVDVYATTNARTLDLERDLCKFKGDTAVALAQISSNIAVNSSNISCIQNTLNGLTKVVIPSTNVCTASTTSTT